MKDQYVGDINDFEKYALLRTLTAASQLPLAVCWMVTPADASGQGNRLQYLNDPDRYSDLDSRLFDSLAEIVRTADRRVGAVEEAGLLERATFFGRCLEDRASSRFVYFREVWESLVEPALVFFDPDVGLAGADVRAGDTGASMYVLDKELSDGYRNGHSLVVFDHWRRVQRLPYLKETLERLRRVTGSVSAFAVWNRGRVAFFVVAQEPHAAGLEAAARSFAAKWPEIVFTDESMLRQLP